MRDLHGIARIMICQNGTETGHLEQGCEPGVSRTLLCSILKLFQPKHVANIPFRHQGTMSGSRNEHNMSPLKFLSSGCHLAVNLLPAGRGFGGKIKKCLYKVKKFLCLDAAVNTVNPD